LDFESDIRARLGKLPKDLSGVYDEIMSSVKSRPGAGFELATRALKWMLVSRRPLKPQELVAATELNPLSTQPGRAVQSSQPPQGPLLDLELVIHVCGGLVLLDQEAEVMRFAHLSVREYLEVRKDSWSIIDTERFVSEGCLWTLLRGPSLMPLLYDYAGRNWFRHCRSYQDIALSQTTEDPNYTLDIPTLNTFLGSFDCPSIRFVEWVGWLPKHEVHEGLNLAQTVESTPLSPAFAAAVCGLGELVSWLWHSEGADLAIKNKRNESLLYLASRYGTIWIMEHIITQAAGVDVDGVQSAYSGTALAGAALSGNLERVSLLLGRGAAINTTFGGEYGTALGMTACSGTLKMATLLLDRGADISITAGHYGTALGVAAYWGNIEMATLLLGRGADINITGGNYGTALGAAAAGGEIGMATLLMDRGADINITGGNYCTALGAAAYFGKIEMATLLLDRGADINITGAHYGNALGVAAYRGNIEIATLLLGRGADINITGGNYGTALGVAAYWGKIEMATLLLDRGADINITGSDYGTALGVAAYWGKIEMATLLLDRGADINITAGHYGTALGVAASRGTIEMATLLLDRDADVNITGGKYGTALGAAAAGGEIGSATLLLSRGADINISSGKYGTALGAAAHRGRLKMATLLLDRGADINTTFGGQYGTALGAAAAAGDIQVTTLLLDRGANLGLANQLGQKPRDLAELGGHGEIVSLLDSYSAGKTKNKQVVDKPLEPSRAIGG